MAEDKFGLVGHEIDQLRFDAIVAKGGFGLVYRGHHLGLDEPVAIKCLNLKGTLDPALSDSFKQRFRDETKIAYRLSKGNLDIVRSISSGTLRAPAGGDMVPYMVLEWLKGRSLADELQEREKDGRRAFSLQEMISTLDPAVTALAYAHEQGVAHRDIKPGNLFLSETREGVRLKVLDFGLAKILHRDAIMAPTQETMNGVYMCSPSYGAPEQFRPKYGEVGPWSDVYSLALVILELLTGQKARPAKNLREAIGMMGETARVEPTAEAMGFVLPAALDRVLRRAVSRYAKDRQADAATFWSEFRDAMLESPEDFETLQNDRLPGRQIVDQAIAKAAAKRAQVQAAAGAPAPPDAPPNAPANARPNARPNARDNPPEAAPPRQERTVRLDRDQLDALAQKLEPAIAAARGRTRPMPRMSAGPANGTPVALVEPLKAVEKTAPHASSFARGPRQGSRAVRILWTVAALALGLSGAILWFALRQGR